MSNIRDTASDAEVSSYTRVSHMAWIDGDINRRIYSEDSSSQIVQICTVCLLEMFKITTCAL